MYLDSVRKHGSNCRGKMLGVALFGLAAILPQHLSAQVEVCEAELEAEALGGPIFVLGDPVTISATFTTMSITGAVDNYLQVNEFEFYLDCTQGDAFPNCTDAGNTVNYLGDGTVTTTCEDEVPQVVSFTTNQTGNQIVFTPSSPIRLPPDSSCNTQWDIEVTDLADQDNTIVNLIGFGQADAACSNNQPVVLASAISFDITAQRAQFRVTKDFTDDNPAGVDVHIECNTGLPLQQSQTISEFGDVGFDHVTFVVAAFDRGELDCHIIENPVPEGYTDSYEAGSITGIADVIDDDEEGCHYLDVEEGTFTCVITDTLDPVEILVTKEWFGDLEAAGIYDTNARADWTCSNVRSAPDDLTLGSEGGSIYFSGNPDTESTGDIYPHYGGTSVCTVDERVYDSAVESDDSDCQSLPIAPGMGNECTITNLVFVEGIPTLNQYGLALLALLMLGIGMIGFRRLA